MKRFTVRKIKQYSYSCQGWKLKDLGYVYAIYDREYWKNLREGYGLTTDRYAENSYKYIDIAYKKEVAQYWADWLNANRADSYGSKIRIPMTIYSQGLDLFKRP